MIIETINISKVKFNPNNPRLIKDEAFKKLVQSIKDFPEMLSIRPIVVNKDLIVLGGNMRLKACIEAGIKKVPVIKARNLTHEQEREFIIKDNVSGGEWDWDLLANEWDTKELDDWGLKIPSFKNSEELEEGELEMDNQYFLNISCKNESECQQLYEKFIKQGLNVKIVT